MFKVTVPTMADSSLDREKILDALRRVGASRVAIVVMRELEYGFSSPKTLSTLADSLDFYDKHGYDPLVWVGQTFGHDTARGGNAKYTTIKCLDTEEGNSSVFCPLDKAFLGDFKKWLIDIAKCGARLILLDDDFRLSYRGTGIGCCCDLHMAALRGELGENIDREQIRAKAFSGGRNKYRDAWLRVQKGSMEDFGRGLREAVDTVDKSIRLGFCASPCGFDLDMDTVRLAQIMAGETKPFIRTLGAPYWATKPNRRHLGEIVNMERMEIEWCRAGGVESIAEGDNFPRPRFATPAAYVETFESILRADGKGDGILKYFWSTYDTFDYEQGYVRATENNRELFGEIERLFSDKDECIGVRPYNVRNMTENAFIDGADKNALTKCERSLYYPSLNFTAVTSMPTSFERGRVNILFGENARSISRDELKNGNVIDIVAAKILTERGIDVGITNAGQMNTAGVSGSFSAVFEYDAEKKSSTAMRGNVRIYDICHADGARVVSHFKIGERFYMGVYEYQNQEGERYLVYPFDAEQARAERNWFNSYWRKQQLIDNLEFLGRKPFEVYDEGRDPMLYILAKKNERSIAVGLWNIFEDKIPSARIHVEGEYSDIRFVNCQGHREGSSVVIDSVIYPFEFAGFELVK